MPKKRIQIKREVQKKRIHNKSDTQKIQKRRIQMKRDVQKSRMHIKSDHKRDQKEETYTHQKRQTKETYTCEKRHIIEWYTHSKKCTQYPFLCAQNKLELADGFQRSCT